MKSIVFIFFLFILVVSCRKKKDMVSASEKLEVPHKRGDVKRLYYSDENAVNIVILGDGFLEEDLKENGSYETKARELADYLFTVQPFTQNRKYFNVYLVYTASANRGAANGASVSGRTTFGSYFNSQTERLLMAGNYDSCEYYAAKAVPIVNAHIIFLLVNDDKYGGSGGSIAVASTNKYSKYIAVHEIGHSFAALGDEYTDEAIAENYPLVRLPLMANVEDNADPNSSKWKHFLEKPAYHNVVGAYSGCYYRDNLYRPEATSIMRELNVLNFNGPSREAIVKKICAITGMVYDREAFFRNDAANIGTIKISAANYPLLPLNDFIITSAFTNRHKTIMQQLKIK